MEPHTTDAVAFAHHGPQCALGVRVSQKSHDALCAAVASSKEETGGAFAFAQDPANPHAWVLEWQEEPQSAEFAKVRITRGVVECHTHPASCTATACTVPLPSAPDMINVLIGARDGVQAHLLYCADGVYIIRLGAELQRLAQSDNLLALQTRLSEVAATLGRLLDRYVTATENSDDGGDGDGDDVDPIVYGRHRVQWMEAAKALGYVVTLVPPGVVPTVPCRAPCEPTDAKPVLPLVRLNTQWMHMCKGGDRGGGHCKVSK
jgi:hypothetical protein